MDSYTWLMKNLHDALKDSSHVLKSRVRKIKLKKLLYEKV